MTTTTYSTDEVDTVRDTVDALTLGMVKICQPIDEDGGLAPDDQAAADRLQQVLTLLDDIYGKELITELYHEICEEKLTDDR